MVYPRSCVVATDL